jgi:hypothetical protein
MTDILQSPVIEEVDLDPSDVAHIVRPARAVAEAYRNGTPVTALCGYTWVPTKDPGPLPVCEACKIAIANMSGPHTN